MSTIAQGFKPNHGDQGGEWHPISDNSVIVNNLSIVYTPPQSSDKTKGKQHPELADGIEPSAILDISFSALAGEAIGLVGTEGSGRSTLLRAIAGQLAATSGQIFVVSEPVMLGDLPTLITSLSLERNLMLAGLARGLSRKQVRLLLPHLVDFTGLKGHLGIPVNACPKSVKDRLEFAATLFTAPDILICDEALSVSDEQLRFKTIAYLKELQAKGTTLFFVCRTLAEVRELCTRVLWLDHGNLIMDGDTDKVVDAFSAYLETPGKENLDPRLFTVDHLPPEPPQIEPLPSYLNRTEPVQIRWGWNDNLEHNQRSASISLKTQQQEWEFHLNGQSNSFELSPKKHPRIFNRREPIKARVRIWGLATTGGSDGMGASEWSKPVEFSLVKVASAGGPPASQSKPAATGASPATTQQAAATSGYAVPLRRKDLRRRVAASDDFSVAE